MMSSDKLNSERRLCQLQLRDVSRHLDKLESLLLFVARDEKTKSVMIKSSGRFYHVGAYASAAYLKTKSFKEYLETQVEMLDTISE